MVTLKDIAHQVGVSVPTVSAALRNTSGVSKKRAKQIRQVAHQLNYHGNISARTLRTGKSHNLTIFVSSLTIPYFALMASLLDREISAIGYEALVRQLHFTHLDEHHILQEAVAQSSTDGFFFVNTSLSSKKILAYTDHRPALIFDDWSGEREIDDIRTPSDSGMREAIRHLVVDCGRKRIALIGEGYLPHHGSQASMSSRQARRQAGEVALEEFSLPVSHDPHQNVDWSVQGGIEAGHWLGKLITSNSVHRFDGAVAMNDLVGLGLLRGLADEKIHIPQDIAIIGFDGIVETSYSIPRLSTIAVDYRGIAHTAVSLMREKINRPQSHPRIHTIVGGYQLLARESTRG